MADTAGLLKFDHPKEQASIIKVLGVGGGGSNAVNHMYKQGIHGVDFVICNTDGQAIEMSPVPVKIQLGSSLTAGNGAGSNPEVGMNAAIENLEDIREVLSQGTRMVFITAGMGGGTGTGGAPIIAKLAKEMGILTIGIVTIPFSFEGRKRKQLAENGIRELRNHVDTLLVINNDKLRELHGDLVLDEAFARADNILTEAAKGIAEIITHVGYINVDFEDVKTVMKDSGVAIMGTGVASGENRAMMAVEEALSSPLLNDNLIAGASNVLLYISSGTKGIRLDEVTEITDYIQQEAGSNAEIIWGNGKNEGLGENIAVTIIATGFNANTSLDASTAQRRPGVIIAELNTRKEGTQASQEQKPPEEDLQIITRHTFTNADLTITGVDNPQATMPDIQPARFPETSTEDTNPAEQETNPGVQPIEMSLKTEKPEEPSFTNPDQPLPGIIRQMGQERIERLRAQSMKLKSNEGLIEIESKPAYQRRNSDLGPTPNAGDRESPGLSVGSSEELKLSDNPFLHKRPD